jgi:hypothetical protein
MERKQHRLPFKVANGPRQVPFEMKLQVIRSKGRATRLFVNVPLALAAALDMQPGERLRWQLLNRSDLRLVRLDAPAPEKNPKK